MKFGTFKQGQEKFGTYAGAPASTLVAGAYRLGLGSFRRFDSVRLPASRRVMVLGPGVASTADVRLAIINSVVSAGGLFYPGVG